MRKMWTSPTGSLFALQGWLLYGLESTKRIFVPLNITHTEEPSFTLCFFLASIQLGTIF
jgi:hypothetical protein